MSPDLALQRGRTCKRKGGRSVNTPPFRKYKNSAGRDQVSTRRRTPAASITMFCLGQRCMTASAGKEVLSWFSRNKKTGSARRVGTLPWIIKFETTALLAPDSFSRKHEKWKRRKHQSLFADVLHGTSCGWLDVLDRGAPHSLDRGSTSLSLIRIARGRWST